MNLSYTHWTAYLIWATGQKRRFKIVCQSLRLSREEIKNIIAV